MLTFHRFLAAGFFAALSVSGCAAVENPKLDDVIARHTEARGGAMALDAVENTLNIATVTEPTFEIVGRYIATTAPSMRIDVFYDGDRVFSEGLDDDGEWQWSGDAPAPQPASDVAIASGALLHGVIFNLYGLHALPALGHKLSIEGREEIDGVSYYKIKISLSDGFETWRYVNPETWMIDFGRDFRPLHPDVDPAPVWIQTKYEDYRLVNGVRTSFRWTQYDLASGDILQSGVIQRLDYNAPAGELNIARGAAVIAP